MAGARLTVGRDDRRAAPTRQAGVDVEAGERAVELHARRTSSRPVGPRSSAASAGSVARSPSRPATASRCSSPRPTASARRRRSPPRSAASTRSASTSSRCAPTTSCAPAPSRSPSSTTSRSAGSIRSAWPSSSAGVAAGCREAGAALVGGETAEHPGLMDADAFDLAGCCIGVVERDRASSTARRSRPATRSSASPSSGLHANGYSLVRALDRPVGPRPGRAVPGAPAADARRRGDRRRCWPRPRTRRWPRSARCC